MNTRIVSKLSITAILMLVMAGSVFASVDRPAPASSLGADETLSTSPAFSGVLGNGAMLMSIGGAGLQSAGSRLVALQNNDGGWDWPLNDGNPANASPKNTIGPIGMGLAKAYRATGDAGMLSALDKVSIFLLAKTNNFSPSDGYLAAELDSIYGVTVHVAHVKANFYDALAAGTYNRNGAGTLLSTAQYVNLIRTSRSGNIANLAAWDIGMGIVGAKACGADVSEWVAGVKAEINELNGAGYYDVIGLAGALYGLASVHEEFDPTGGIHADASNLKDLADILVSYQIVESGGFAWNSAYVIPNDGNEAIQETAYAIMALNAMQGYRDEITAAVNYMLSVQLGTGGWANDPSSGENNEITAEGAWGVSLANNVLSLEPTAASVYVKPGESVVVNMNVSNLLQMVNGCQALIGFSSNYLTAPHSVVPGGNGVWQELIYEMWNDLAGELDTAIGIQLEGTLTGTQSDSTVAIITLTAGTTEGVTRMVFRADGTEGYATMLSDLSANAVWPAKVNSTNIYIDGTPPSITCPANVVVSTNVGVCQATGVDLGMPVVTDAVSGVDFVTNNAPAVFPKGETIVTWTATDNAGNSATCEQTVTVNDTESPAIACPANITVNADAGLCSATLGYTDGFDSSPVLSATSAPNAWYVDRYAPAGFVAATLGGRNCLKHSISSADSLNNRPAGYRSTFYNTQGRKFNVNMTVPGSVQVDLYVPADWQSSMRRADLWATIINSHGEVSGYPIAGFVNDNGSSPRFRAWMDEGSGGWIDLGLPEGFAYDQWYTIKVDISATQYVYTISGGSSTLTEVYPKVEDEVLRIANVMLQAYNFGESYDVYWDDVTVGPQGPIVTDNCQVASVVAQRSDSPLGLNDPFPKGITTITWIATDTSGNVSTCEQTVEVVDIQAPAIDITGAMQGSLNVLGGGGASNAVQGEVVITVTASDNCGDLPEAPEVSVRDSADVEIEVTLVSSDAGTWTYSCVITPTTANGLATITATVTDESGNVANDSDTFNINKHEITGKVELESFIGTSRAVTFVATNSSGAVLKTWAPMALDFTGGKANYLLTDVPADTANLSAKTDWTLRERLAALYSDDRAVVDFVGDGVSGWNDATDHCLRGGDLNGDNFVNVLDYSILKANWGAGLAGDIDGNASTWSIDYVIMQRNWFKAGDAR